MMFQPRANGTFIRKALKHPICILQCTGILIIHIESDIILIDKMVNTVVKKEPLFQALQMI